jgi:hypothetical protein
VQDNIVRYCLNNAEQHDQFLPVYYLLYKLLTILYII